MQTWRVTISTGMFMTFFFIVNCTAMNNFCDKIEIQKPFLIKESPLYHMSLCKSEKLYFRTTLGLFLVSSIDYESKTLTISQPSNPVSSTRYISPLILSAGFPSSPPQPNSLVLFNCTKSNLRVLRNCSSSLSLLHETGLHKVVRLTSSCLLVDDVSKLRDEFHLKQMDCSHHSLVHRRRLEGSGLWGSFDIKDHLPVPDMSFDIKDHLPDECKDCKDDSKSCGVGMKCICQFSQCTDKVIDEAVGSTVNKVTNKRGSLTSALGTSLLALLSFTIGTFPSLIFKLVSSLAS